MDVHRAKRALCLLLLEDSSSDEDDSDEEELLMIASVFASALPAQHTDMLEAISNVRAVKRLRFRGRNLQPGNVWAIDGISQADHFLRVADDSSYQILFRMRRVHFERLVEILRPRIEEAQNRGLRREVAANSIRRHRAASRGLSATHIVAAGLIRMAGPTKFSKLAMFFNKSASVMHSAVDQALYSFATTLKDREIKLLTPDELHAVERRVVELYGHTVGDRVAYLVDGTVFYINRPTFEQRSYYNGYYKGHTIKAVPLITPLPVPESRVCSLIHNLPGIVSDSSAFQLTDGFLRPQTVLGPFADDLALVQRRNQEIAAQADADDEEDNEEQRVRVEYEAYSYLIGADSAFPDTDYVIKPYNQNEIRRIRVHQELPVTEEEINDWNRAFSAMRVNVENYFGNMKMKWRMLYCKLDAWPERRPFYVMAGFALTNYCHGCSMADNQA